jgi:hypothetical protein
VLSNGDFVLLVGRRRRATYAIINVEKSKKEICSLPENLAKNLRLRNGDKLKVIPLGSHDNDSRSGDMSLLKYSKPPHIASATISPIEDSLNALSAREGGDELSDDEILQRFITPYMNAQDSNGILKKDSVVAIVDDNGRKLEFVVSHMELAESIETNDEEGTSILFLLFNA